MYFNFLHIGVIALFVLSASCTSDDYSGDWSTEDYENYDDDEHTEVAMGGSGDGGIVEITPRRLENVEMKTVQETLNTTDNSTTETATTASIATLATANSNVTGGPNVNLIHLDPTMAPVITTESFEAYDLQKCPEKCKCSDGTQFVNCSSLQLTHIPAELPSDALQLDLSHNNLEVFDVAELQNATKLRGVLLSHNKIHSIINTESFTHLPHLGHLNLASNALQNLTGDEFNDAQQLTKLALSHNPLELKEGKVLVNVTDLEVLNLIGCNITELYNSTFAPNSGLLKLNLNKNPLPEKINVHAFHSLINLKELHIPRIDQSVSLDLCNTLSGIDAVSIGTFEISCFELVSGHSFEDSTAILSTEQSKSFDRSAGNSSPPSAITTSMAKEIDPTTSEKIVEATTGHMKEAGDKSVDQVTVRSSTTLPSPSVNDAEVVAAPEQNNRVEISAKSVNNILIGIIVLALLGLTIGVICRQDCFGIKTKMCRTRRPAATDQVRPAEEVPLNKVQTQ